VKLLGIASQEISEFLNYANDSFSFLGLRWFKTRVVNNLFKFFNTDLATRLAENLHSLIKEVVLIDKYMFMYACPDPRILIGPAG